MVRGKVAMWFACAVTSALATAQRASALVVDQSNLPSTFNGNVYSISAAANLPIGQEFRPTLSVLDFVDLHIQDVGSDVGAGANVIVFVRATTIHGATVGASTTTFVPDNTNLGGGAILTRFNFTSPVSLIPGNTYVLQVMQTGSVGPGNWNFGWGGSFAGAGTYPDGRAILQGNPIAGTDFWFREGILIPEPGAASFIACGAIAFLSRVRRRPS